MKLNKWLFGIAAMAMMASCSDNLSDGPSKGEAEEGGSGYIGINIQLPTVIGTRANDDFEDGELSEYRIEEAALFLFQGADEANATYQGAYKLQESEPNFVKDDQQITRQSVRVANVKGLDVNTKLFALVMVNGEANGIYNTQNPNGSGNWSKGMKIKDFQEKILNNALFEQTTKGKDYASSIFMTNSPLSTKQGGGSDPGQIQGSLPVLVELDPTTYITQSEALANPAGTIHIERSVAKITCKDFPATTGIKVMVNDLVNDKDYEYTLNVASVSWDMAQDMANTYAVRNTNRSPVVSEAGTSNLWVWTRNSEFVSAQENKYRMLGASPIFVGENKYYRPYFCQVPGYNVPKYKDENGQSLNGEIYENKVFTKSVMEARDAITWTGLTSPGAFYPRENTFPVEYMKYANTTRIGFWVTFEFTSTDPDAPKLDKNINFYINGLDKQTLYVDDSDGNDPLTNRALNELMDREKYNTLWNAVSKALNQGETAGSVEAIELKDLVNFTYDETKRAKSGEIEITAISFKTLSEINTNTNNIFEQVPDYTFGANLITGLNNLGQFTEYTLGKTFYEVRIKHFGNDQTPWNEDEVAATTIDESYGNVTKKEITKDQRDNNYLGRYGLVRNNWYELDVKNILKLGYPKDPAKWDDSWPGKPDDNKDQYIAVELRVLSWAKRTQNVTF